MDSGRQNSRKTHLQCFSWEHIHDCGCSDTVCVWWSSLILLIVVLLTVFFHAWTDLIKWWLNQNKDMCYMGHVCYDPLDHERNEALNFKEQHSGHFHSTWEWDVLESVTEHTSQTCHTLHLYKYIEDNDINSTLWWNGTAVGNKDHRKTLFKSTAYDIKWTYSKAH